MRKLLLTIELEYDNELYGDDPEEKDWLFNHILLNNIERDTSEELILFSNEIGDEVGIVTVIDIQEIK